MKKFLKSLLSGALLCSVCYLVIGIILILVPELAMETLVRAAAIGLLVLGAVNLVRYWIRGPKGGVLNNFMVDGLVLIIAGIVLLIKPGLVTGIVPVLLGIALMVDGLVKLQRSIDLLRVKYEGWIFVLLMAAMTLGVGALVLIDPFKAAKTLAIITGVGLAFAGALGIVIWIIVGSKMKKIRKQLEEAEAAKAAETGNPVDVEAQEAPVQPEAAAAPVLLTENAESAPILFGEMEDFVNAPAEEAADPAAPAESADETEA